MLALLLYYDKIEHAWHSLSGSKLISNIVLVAFGTGLFVTLLTHFGVWQGATVNHFFAIELAFNVLLMSELLSLVFVFSRSVADSVGVQFEIVSLILLRNSFKEIGHLPFDVPWNRDTLFLLLPVLADAVGAVLIFLITGLFYKAQQHQRITSNAREKDEFTRVKKGIAICLLISFVALGLHDLTLFIKNRVYSKSINMYYTLLIFTDIFVLIYSLRFSTRYNNLFRYSSFALATVIIRMALSAPQYYNVLLSIVAGLFVLVVTYIYNHLNETAVVAIEQPLPNKPLV